MEAALPPVADANYFRCLVCERQIPANYVQVTEGRYGIEEAPTGERRLIGTCSFCRSLLVHHMDRYPKSNGMAHEMRELRGLASDWRRRGCSPEVARTAAVDQQVRAEDLQHPEFFKWLYKAGRL